MRHVAAFIAEVLGHGQAGQRHAQTVAGRLVHLAVDQSFELNNPPVDSIAASTLRRLPVVFEGMTYTFEDDRFSYSEQRFVTLGLLAGIPVSVVHTVIAANLFLVKWGILFCQSEDILTGVY